MIQSSESGTQSSRQQKEKRWFSAPSVKTEVEYLDSGTSDKLNKQLQLPAMNERTVVTLMSAENAIDWSALNHDCPGTGDQTKPSIALQSDEIFSDINSPTYRPESGRHNVLPPIQTNY